MMARAIPAWILIVAAWAAISAAPAAALPAALAYPGLNGALSAPNEAEQALLDQIQSDRRGWRLAPLVWDGMMSAVAREHSEDMAEYDHMEYATPRLGTIEYRLHRSGIPAANARYAIFRAGSLEGLKEQLVDAGLQLENSTHAGVGAVTKGILPRRLFVTLILVERRSELDRFPTMPLPDRTYRLSGRIDAGYSDPELIITAPDGSVDQRALESDGKGRFDDRVRFDKGPGKYSVELAAQGPLGAAILDLMHCYAGVPYPPPAAPNATETPKEIDRAEMAMLGLINRTRSEFGLPALEFDAKVAAVARKHSQDMQKGRFFAHNSPTNGSLQDRLERGGIRARRYAENLASNRGLGDAHQGLMDSPGHRKNILDPEVTRVGIGIARSEDGQLLITENFIQPFQEYDAAQLTERLLDAMNAARREAGAAALSMNATLTNVARANSNSMRKNGKGGYETASRLLDEKAPRLKYVQISVLESTDPPEPGQVADALDRRYSIVGIGIVQGEKPTGEKPLYTTVLLGER
jgi:uncharacterized protein YkwD